MDGRDPNSYAGVGWVYGVHDRAWAERPIFGKTRYMAASGLERKCDIAAYVKKVDDLVKKGGIITPQQKTLRLILAEQLDELHAWFKTTGIFTY